MWRNKEEKEDRKVEVKEKEEEILVCMIID